MGIFMKSCSYSDCQYAEEVIDPYNNVVYCLCHIDEEVCDFDSTHPSSLSCRNFEILSCSLCSHEWGCELE